VNGSIWSQPPGRFGVGVGVGDPTELVAVGGAAVRLAPACDWSDPPDVHAAVSAAIPTSTSRATNPRTVMRSR